MKILLTTQSLPLFLVLLQPLPLQVLMQRRYLDLPDHVAEELEDYSDELYSTGPTKPPTKKSFQRHVIIPPLFPFYHHYDCTFEMKERNVHDRFFCRKEHFFLPVAYEELQKTCNSKYVACKNGLRRCHKTKKLIKVLHCKLTHGTKMSDCEYQSFYKEGYALITCRWQDDIGEIIPEHVNGILELPNNQ
ncbi:inactive ribonuclease-like protein 9 [Pteronotus mesoamericanus]|uniref:inactive ribonuclease-like protein 9 n=1 Tax=Pteronotus mesoamericanus TaxID=1884717 RepID=UPI0023ED7A80|nr:inactive ribonuclease-like protein 9 [Pteronotus parnellii mesoamericanus]